MNTLILIFLLLSIPIIFQVRFGNKSLNNEIRLPYLLVCLLSFLVLSIMTVISVYIAKTLEIAVFGIFSGALLIGLIAIQAYVFYVNSDKKSK